MNIDALMEDAHDFMPNFDKVNFAKFKTAKAAANAAYKALVKDCKLHGMNPDYEVYKRKEGGAGVDGYLRIGWESGPYQWAVKRFVSGPWGYAEPHFSFDLCFYDTSNWSR